jgi:hypothetical protein
VRPGFGAKLVGSAITGSRFRFRLNVRAVSEEGLDIERVLIPEAEADFGFDVERMLIPEAEADLGFDVERVLIPEPEADFGFNVERVLIPGTAADFGFDLERVLILESGPRTGPEPEVTLGFKFEGTAAEVDKEPGTFLEIDLRDFSPGFSCLTSCPSSPPESASSSSQG